MKSLIMHTARSIIAVLFYLSSTIAMADIVVVVSAQSEVMQLQRVDVENIFLGRNFSFPGGEGAIPIDLEEGNSLRDEFYMKLTGRTAAQIKSYWAKLIFTGRGRPPAIAKDQEELIDRLLANPNTIGYLDSSNLDDRVKVVFRPTLITGDSSATDAEPSLSTRYLGRVQ